ncbi:integral membrane sensor signal transduction histidine kinase [Halovivax asiaticus JCM 14624]|uniref:histidine kinase n=1 Tax=Halovivax asiaticus JCM 14624 TaxID=1227490 RepID=M0BLA3_9EURY|nr:HAMP domain-containing sensor histidine kinase [Halovivax asiaticus]ELZ11073.1 integral membrane sensor signal transduction histidine kinase [Halovivax asiaticus JCM 14624]
MNATVEEDDWVADVAERLPFSPLSALGLFLAMIISVRTVVEQTTSQAILESIGPLAAATAVVVADRYLVSRDVAPRDRLTVFAWGLSGFLAAALVTALHLLVLSMEGVGPRNPLYLTLLSGTIGVAAGSVAGWYEIRQRAAVREARRQRERLDQFASVVSHDLRNPLSVADGRLQEAFRTGDAEHLHVVDECLDRMDELIDDSLSVARSGSEVIDPEPVPLVDLAASAWDAVDTGDATLELEGDRTLRVEESRAQSLFENCFRNAVEHGGADTVRVGPLRTGFYVEDDGTGIPEDVRDSLFQQGVSSSQDGSGLGLAIVQAVAEAHGWEPTVTESDEGGARFEF